MPATSSRAALIVRATLRAYETAIADGADDEAAFRTACTIYRLGYPRAPESVVRHMVAVIVRRPPPTKGRATKPKKQERQGTKAIAAPAVAAARLAYISAIADGARPTAAFEVAKAAFRARRPEFSGERLDDVVARALATDEEA